MTREEIADARIRYALDQIENGAQCAIGEAVAALSSVQFMAPEYARLRKLYDRIHAEWYRLRDSAARKRESQRARPRLDRDYDPRYDDRYLPPPERGDTR